MTGYDWRKGNVVTRFTPTGDSRPSMFPCVICHESIEGPGAEYIKIEVLNSDGLVVYSPRESIRRHFLNDRHAVTLLTIDHRPSPVAQAF